MVLAIKKFTQKKKCWLPFLVLVTPFSVKIIVADSKLYKMHSIQPISIGLNHTDSVNEERE
jgi:hypothetical protein